MPPERSESLERRPESRHEPVRPLFLRPPDSFGEGLDGVADSRRVEGEDLTMDAQDLGDVGVPVSGCGGHGVG